MEPLTVQLVVSVANAGGLAALGTFVVRFVLGRVWAHLEREAERQYTMLTNHLSHNTEVLEQLKGVIEANTKAVDKLATLVGD